MEPAVELLRRFQTEHEEKLKVLLKVWTRLGCEQSVVGVVCRTCCTSDPPLLLCLHPLLPSAPLSTPTRVLDPPSPLSLTYACADRRGVPSFSSKPRRPPKRPPPPRATAAAAMGAAAAAAVAAPQTMTRAVMTTQGGTR